MTTFQPPQIDMKPIVERLIRARDNAGLSQWQVERILGIRMSEPAVVVMVENFKIPLSVELLFQLCAIYDVDVTWVLTGHNPYFDEAAVLESMSNANISDEDKAHLLESLRSLRQEVKP